MSNFQSQHPTKANPVTRSLQGCIVSRIIRLTKAFALDGPSSHNPCICRNKEDNDAALPTGLWFWCNRAGDWTWDNQPQGSTVEKHINCTRQRRDCAALTLHTDHSREFKHTRDSNLGGFVSLQQISATFSVWPNPSGRNTLRGTINTLATDAKWPLLCR